MMDDLSIFKDKMILTWNLNGWLPIRKDITFGQKLKKASEEITFSDQKPIIIMLQEMIGGRDRKYIDLLEKYFKDYKIILPAGFDYHRHSRSIFSVTLIRKDVLGSYKLFQLDEQIPNRICSLVAEIDGVPTYIINAHVVQIQNFRNEASWYIQERKRLHTRQWKLLHEFLHENRESNVILGGDLQEGRDGENISMIRKDGYIMDDWGFPTVKNAFFKEEPIDHLAFSISAKEIYGATDLEIMFSACDYNSELGAYSDHFPLYNLPMK